MIVVARAIFDSTCVSRGYLPDEVAACIVQDSGSTLLVDETHAAYPRARPGLGDMVAAGLSAIGITKERVSALAGGDCGCSKRQEALNELGRKIGIG